MTTITIPKKITKEKKLVAIPVREYAKFLDFQRKAYKTKLDKDLEQALKEVREGKTVGPFSSAKELMRSLEK